MPEVGPEKQVRQEGRGLWGVSGETGEPLTHSCLLWTMEAACCDLECVLARVSVTEPLTRGGLAEGGPPFVVLKGTACHGQPSHPVSLGPLR